MIQEQSNAEINILEAEYSKKEKMKIKLLFSKKHPTSMHKYVRLTLCSFLSSRLWGNNFNEILQCQIEMQRYRLRKKLDLEREDSLVAYMVKL